MYVTKGKETSGCKWIIIVRYKTDGTVERYKVKVVAKGYA